MTATAGVAPRPACVRPAVDGDFERIAAIYAYHVLHGTATFEYQPPTAEEMRRRCADVAERGLPWLVAIGEGEVAGYAYAGPYRSRPAYAYTVEDSLYLDPAWYRRGMGRALLGALICRCTEAGFRQMVAVIGDSANTASTGLHQAMGFETAGILRNVGWKFGRWLDTVLMQRSLGAGSMGSPERPAPG